MKKKHKTAPACEWGFENPPFTREMKETYTILAPDIFPIHLELVRRVMEMYGFHVVVLKSRGRDIIECGLEHLHNDMCYPAICMCGQQLHALTSGEYDPHKCALIQFQTGGGCRASNYIWMLRKALHNMNMDYVPVLSLSFTQVEKASDGFRITVPMIAKGLVAIIYGDMLMLLKNQVEPYAKRREDVTRLLETWYERLEERMKKNRGLFGRGLNRTLREIAKDFSEIEVTDEKKTKVGIVGEIYVKYSPFGNNGLEEFLFEQGCEVMVPGVFAFFQFMFDNKLTDSRLYGTSRSSAFISRIGEKLCRKIERDFKAVLADFPRFAAPASFKRLCELGDAVIGRPVKMGEGWLLPAEAAELIEKGYRNVITVQPFGCLPNHIVAKGTVRTLRGMYPDANICPIDFDAGASRVNQENRIKLMLAVAREAEANEKTGN